MKSKRRQPAQRRSQPAARAKTAKKRRQPASRPAAKSATRLKAAKTRTNPGNERGPVRGFAPMAFAAGLTYYVQCPIVIPWMCDKVTSVAGQGVSLWCGSDVVADLTSQIPNNSCPGSTAYHGKLRYHLLCFAALWTALPGNWLAVVNDPKWKGLKFELDLDITGDASQVYVNRPTGWSKIQGSDPAYPALHLTLWTRVRIGGNNSATVFVDNYATEGSAAANVKDSQGNVSGFAVNAETPLSSLSLAINRLAK